MARSLQCCRLGLRVGIQCHECLFKAAAPGQSSTLTLPSPFFLTVVLHATTTARGIGSRGGRLGRPPSRGHGGSQGGSVVVAPRAHRRHLLVDAEDFADGTPRAAVLAAGGIGSMRQLRHLLHLLPLSPRRPSPSLLTGSSSASPSTTAPTRTPSG
jgi:hypothetical protein